MKRHSNVFLSLLLASLGLSANTQAAENSLTGYLDQRLSEPSEHTLKANERVSKYLPFDDQEDIEAVQRGRKMAMSKLKIYPDTPECNTRPDDCHPIWDMTQYEFLNSYVVETGLNFSENLTYEQLFPAAPELDSVNPSLRRMATLNTIHGIFEVSDNIYQARGYDLANMSAIKGDTGWIIVDPLLTAETAAAAMNDLNTYYMEHVATSDEKANGIPVVAIIFTHSHVDHFGGVNGLKQFLAAGVDINEIPIIAPEGFFEESVSENVIVGNAMGRRASYMYGPLLRRGPKGQVDGGLGKSTPSGTTAILEPNCTINTGTYKGCESDIIKTPDELSKARQLSAREQVLSEELVIMDLDGIRVQFQNVPGSEAPAELMFYFPDSNALCGSEDITHTFHNVLTLRGANVRDSLMWAKYLDKTLEYFKDIDVVFASHHWPTWNDSIDGDKTGAVENIIEKQRDLYRYIHDQSVRLTNQGYTIQEIGELVKLPDSLGREWFNRSYYGTVNHNAKAVYQRYIGWFDGNPASLHQLPPAAAATEYVRYMGGVESILEKAQEDYEAGRYRWVAMVLNQVMFATANKPRVVGEKETRDVQKEARLLLAKTYEQLGYQAESGPWRNFYLTGAMELRNGVLPLPAVKTFTRDTVEVMTLDMIFDFLAIHLNGLKADGMDYTYYVNIDDDNEKESMLILKNSVLNNKLELSHVPLHYDAQLKLSRDTLNDIVMGEATIGELICSAEADTASGCIQVSGGVGVTTDEAVKAAQDLASVMETFDFWFNIVTPNPAPVSLN